MAQNQVNYPPSPCGRGLHFFIIVIECYQKYLSPFLGDHCRFEPSCSWYAKTALQQFGFWKGSLLALKRLLRCHPFCKGGYDPVVTHLKEI